MCILQVSLVMVLDVLEFSFAAEFGAITRINMALNRFPFLRLNFVMSPMEMIYIGFDTV